MSYRRPPNDPYWQPHGSMPPSSYHNDFNQSTNFDVEDFIFNSGDQQRQHVAGGVGQGYPYDSRYQPLDDLPGYRRHSEASQPFNQCPSWTQPTRPQTFSDNHPVGQMHDGRLGMGPPEPEQAYQQQRLDFIEAPNPQLDQQRDWRGTSPQSSHQDHHIPPPHTKDEPKDNHKPPPAGVADNTDSKSCIPEVSDEPPTIIQQDEPADDGSNNDEIILHPITKVPVKRKPNGTYELVEEPTKKAKKPGPSPAPRKPKKLPKEIGDGCYCELCDLVCSGPLNLRMHIGGAKHKLNESKVLKGEKTIVRKKLDKKLRDRFADEGPIPSDHNQEETPIIGLDFVTRVVVPYQDASEDVFDCSLCDKTALMGKCVYTHVIGRAHRKAYIRKFKPDLADQYSNIANVYNKSGQLQRRQSSDLTALLNNIVKIAAKRDGPGEMQIRLCNEDFDGEEDTEDYGVPGYNSEPEDVDNVPLGSEVEERVIANQRAPNRYSSNQPPAYPPIPRAPYTRLNPQPSEIIPPRHDMDTTAAPSLQLQPAGLSNSQPPVPRSSSLERPPLPPNPKLPVTHLSSRALSPENISPRALPAPNNQPRQSVTRLSPRLSSPPKAQFNTTAPTQAVTRLPPKESLQTTGQNIFPADLPPLSDEQLRFYCSDAFIAQEYRRRFGDPTQHANTSRPGPQQNNQSKEGSSSISQAASGISVEMVLKSLSDTMVNSEDDANMAMELTRALTQATLKYRLREKNFALQGKGEK